MDNNYKKIYSEVEKILAEDSLLKVQDRIDRDISKAIDLPSLDILSKDSSKAKNGIYNDGEKLPMKDIFPVEKDEKVEIIDEIPPENSKKLPHIHVKNDHCHYGHHHCHLKYDVVSFDIPLFLRMLEYAKEDAKSDLDLHFVTENIILLSKQKSVLTMDDYKAIVDIEQSEEESDIEELDFYDFKEGEDGILEAKKKKKKVRFPRRGYGFIWPIWPMGMRPPPPPKPPKPDEKPDDVTNVEDVSDEVSSETPSVDSPSSGISSASSSTSIVSVDTGSTGGGEAVSVGDGGAGAAGGGASAGGSAGGGAAGGAVAESDENEIPIGDKHKRKIEDMDKRELAELVVSNYGKILKSPKDIVNDKLIETINVKSVLGGPDQSIFIKFKNLKDGKENFAHFELDDKGNLKISEKWTDNLGEHLYSSEEILKERVYPNKKPEEINLSSLWP